MFKKKALNFYFILLVAMFFTGFPILNNADATGRSFAYINQQFNALKTRDLGTSAVIKSKAFFIPVLEITNNDISVFLSKLYDKKNYYVKNTQSYTINKNKKTIMVSCSLTNGQGTHIQYIEKTTSVGITGCPVLLHKKLVALKKSVVIQRSRFVEVNIINI